MRSWPIREHATAPGVFQFTVRIGASTANFAEVQLSIARGSTATISWGDGVETDYTSGGWKDHTYTANGIYQVTIVGSFQVVRFGHPTASNPSLISVDTPFPPIPDDVSRPVNVSFEDLFSLCLNLTSVHPMLLRNYREDGVIITSLYRMFTGCYSLIYLPENFLEGLTFTDQPFSIYGMFWNCYSLLAIFPKFFDYPAFSQVEDASVLFQNCRSLSIIPPGLFDRFTGLKYLGRAFMGCSGLQEIGLGLLNNCTLLENVGFAFRETGLLSIPPGLFANTPHITSFLDTFWQCVRITGNVPELWVSHPNADGGGCFTGCSNADNWDDIPRSWGGPAG